MAKQTSQLQYAIEDELLRIETAEGYKLSAHSAAFLIDSCTEFVTRNIHKFIAGAQEHGDDFLTTVDHVDETYKEILDLFNYVNAIRHNKQLHDRRYTVTS